MAVPGRSLQPRRCHRLFRQKSRNFGRISGPVMRVEPWQGAGGEDIHSVIKARRIFNDFNIRDVGQASAIQGWDEIL